MIAFIRRLLGKSAPLHVRFAKAREAQRKQWDGPRISEILDGADKIHWFDRNRNGYSDDCH